jgi:hypothetical protein
MKYFICVLFVLSVVACGGKPTLNDEDTDYVRTTLDLLRTRANFIPTEDSTQIKQSLDSVYRRHHTSAADYKAKTVALADDAKRTEAIFGAINDSISKKDSVTKK